MMQAEIHKPNWLFRGLIFLSVGVHLIGLIHLTSIYQPNLVSRIELTLQSIKSQPQPKIVTPPTHPEKPQDAFDRPSTPEAKLYAPITLPDYQPPEPVLAERLQKLPTSPQIPDKSDPIATVWEDPPEGSQTAAVPAPSSIRQDTGLAEIQYIDRITQKINAAKEYPQRARRRSLEGVVKVLFTIGASGELVSISILTSSGSRILDRSAIKAVQNAAPFDPPPNETVTIELPIKYQLT